MQSKVSPSLTSHSYVWQSIERSFLTGKLKEGDVKSGSGEAKKNHIHLIHVFIWCCVSSLSSFPPLRLPIRFPGFGAGMIRNATHLIRNTFLSAPASPSSSSSSSTPLTSSGSSSGSSLGSSLSSSLGSSLNSNSLSQILSPLLPLLNFGSGSPLQAANRNGLIDPSQYAPYFRALQLRRYQISESNFL